jgi:hypothetical protein
MQNPLKPARLTTQTGPQGEQDDSKISSLIKYKKVTSPKTEKYDKICICSTCRSVGIQFIIQQYANFQNVLIQDNSSLIFDPLSEKVVGQ